MARLSRIIRAAVDALGEFPCESADTTGQTLPNYTYPHGYDKAGNRTLEYVVNTDMEQESTFNSDNEMTEDRYIVPGESGPMETVVDSYDANGSLTLSTDDEWSVAKYVSPTNVYTNSYDSTSIYIYDPREHMIQADVSATISTVSFGGGQYKETALAVVESTTDTTYGYDDQGERVSSVTGQSEHTGTYYFYGKCNYLGYSYAAGSSSTSATIYLMDENSITTYPQELSETTVTGGTLPSTTHAPTVSDATGPTGILAQSGTVNGYTGLLGFTKDGHGNTRTLLNPGGTAVQDFTPTAFDLLTYTNPGGGVVGIALSAAFTTHFFPDGVVDDSTGLIDDNARWRIGPSFLQADFGGYGSNESPITLNGYTLDGADPINMSDMNGHLCELDIGADTLVLSAEASEDLAATEVRTWAMNAITDEVIVLSIVFSLLLQADQGGSGTDIDDPEPPDGEVALYRAPRASNPDPAAEVKFGFNPVTVPGQSSPAGVYFGTSPTQVNYLYRTTTGYWNGIQVVFLTTQEFHDLFSINVIMPDPAHFGWGYYVPVGQLPTFNTYVIAHSNENIYIPNGLLPGTPPSQ